MEGQQPISWYPGHMAKARRQLEAQLKRVDVVLEVCDARLPLSSRNPALDEMLLLKPRLLLMNKEDLADPAATARWEAYFRERGVQAIPMRAGRQKSRILKLVDSLTEEKRRRAQARGISAVSRAMVVGVPNVGKSTLINTLAGRSALKVQDRPGVTRAPQWIKAGERLELLDTPACSGPSCTTRRRPPPGLHRAIRDEALDVYGLAVKMMDELMETAPGKVTARQAG